MQVSFSINDKVYETLKQGAEHFGIDITDMLEHGADLAALKVKADMAREEARLCATWSVDTVTKAVTRVGPPEGTHVTATEVRAFSHPLAKPGDWDRAMARAMRNPPAPT